MDYEGQVEVGPFKNATAFPAAIIGLSDSALFKGILNHFLSE